MNLPIPNYSPSTSLIYFSFLYPPLSCNIQMLAVMVKFKVYLPKFFGKYKNSHPHICSKGLNIISDLPKMSQEKKG